MDEVEHDRNGALWTYRFEDGAARALADSDAAAAGGWTWRHFPLSDHRARRYLERLADLPDGARDLLAHTDERLQIHREGGWTFGVLPDFERDLSGRVGDAGRLLFLMDDQRLFTARRHALRVIDDVRHEFERGATLGGPCDAFERLIERFLELCEQQLEDSAAGLDRIEDRVLSERGRQAQPELGPVRRILSRNHREFLALRAALARALGQKSGLADGMLAARLPDLIQRLEDYDRETGSLQDRARLLHEEIGAQLDNATNRNLRILTIISTLMMPPTLLVGAFGMNVKAIPWSDDANGFWLACALCVAGVGGAYAVLRRFGILG